MPIIPRSSFSPEEIRLIWRIFLLAATAYCAWLILKDDDKYITGVLIAHHGWKNSDRTLSGENVAVARTERGRMTGMQVVIECDTCGNLSKGTILPRVTQGDLFGDLGFAVSSFLDKNGNERRCPRCEAILLEHGAKVFVVYRLGRIA